MRAVGAFKERPTLSESIDVRRRETTVVVTTHVGREQGIDSHQHDIWMFCHKRPRCPKSPSILSRED